jgi:hypothetical protein
MRTFRYESTPAELARDAHAVFAPFQRTFEIGPSVDLRVVLPITSNHRSRLAQQRLRHCHAKTVSQAIKQKRFDEEACETMDATKSCRAKYSAAVAKVLASPRAPCPPCLGTTQATQLGDGTERDLDEIRGMLYCAGTAPLP